LGAILDTPGLADRLLEALRPEAAAGNGSHPGARARAGLGGAANEEGRRIR